VSKLRENAKQVIGVGVKKSTSDLLIANCDEFIFYDDLVRDEPRTRAARPAPAAPTPARRPQEEGGARAADAERRRERAIDLVIQTVDALLAERGDGGKLRASLIKDALKRRQPHFSESYHGFRSFGSLLEEASARGEFELGRDDKSNVYVQRAVEPPAAVTAPVAATPAAEVAEPAPIPAVARSGDAADEVPEEDAQPEAPATKRAPRKRAPRKTASSRPRSARKNAAPGDSA